LTVVTQRAGSSPLTDSRDAAPCATGKNLL
jgi:hypothetical protein